MFPALHYLSMQDIRPGPGKITNSETWNIGSGTETVQNWLD